MNKEQKALFVKLVKEGAPWRAFQKSLGITRGQYQTHLGQLASIEAELAKPEAKPLPLKKSVESQLKAIAKDKKIKKAPEVWNEEDDTL